ncbi:hypothetical protein niasHT_030372 [Heterodera trifolii]|uniref:Uncharacterized protein n=1 Tax=Heterodera trifolii TaxID=157864 RepID=A0ABD2KP72_9BILA
MEESFGQASVRSRMLAQGRALQERVGREGNQNQILAEKAFCFEFERPSAHSNSDELGRSGYGGRAVQEQNLVERLKAELMRVTAERDEAEEKVEILHQKLLDSEQLFKFIKANHIKLLVEKEQSGSEFLAMEAELKTVKEKLEMAEKENGHFSILSVQQNLMAHEQSRKIKGLMEEVAELKAKDRGKGIEEFSKNPKQKIAVNQTSDLKPQLKLNIVKKSKANIAKPKKYSKKPEAEKCNIRPLNSIIFRKPPPQVTPNYRPPSLNSIRTFPPNNGTVSPFSNFAHIPLLAYPTPSPYLAPASPIHYFWLISADRMADESIPNFIC